MSGERMRSEDRSPLGSLLARFDRSGALQESESAASSDEVPTASQGLTRADLCRAAVISTAAAGVLGTATAGAAQRNPGDTKILNYALGLEYLQAAFYTEAVQAGALSGALAQQAQVVGAHERAHVAALREVLGSAAIKAPTFDFRGDTEHPAAFRKTAVALEDLTVAAYQQKAPQIQSPGYLVAIVAIQSVEARHASWIRRLAGIVPAPTAFDEPVSEPRTERIVDATHFIVNGAHTSAHGSPEFTG